jgi:3-methyl-2-oxobutanoate hydroxymethyltransferase
LISRRISIPTLGIGAGIGCDGQVLVVHDMLGFFDRFTPKFVKKYADLHVEMERVFGEFITDVIERRFPAVEHSVEMPDKEWETLLAELAEEPRP